MNEAMDMVAVRARARLIWEHAYFGTLALGLDLVEDPTIGTAATDGTTLWYSPKWLASQADREQVCAIAHEAMHCGLLHPYRMQDRDPEQWNVACDYVVNLALQDGGMKLPPGALVDPQYRSMSAEEVYAKRRRQPSDPPPGRRTKMVRPSKPQPGKPRQRTEADWTQLAEDAASIARRTGRIPGGVDRALAKSRESRTDWREALRQFVQAVVPQDYTWTRHNAAYAAHGVYLPGILREGCPPLGIAVDTSGSIRPADLETFSAEIKAILAEVKPERIDVVYADAAVHGSEVFGPEDAATFQLHVRGGGGTDFQPALDWFSRQPMTPAAVIYLTDLEADPPQEPSYPVLWVVPEGTTRQAPFGPRVVLR